MKVFENSIFIVFFSYVLSLSRLHIESKQYYCEILLQFKTTALFFICIKIQFIPVMAKLSFQLPLLVFSVTQSSRNHSYYIQSKYKTKY